MSRQAAEGETRFKIVFDELDAAMAEENMTSEEQLGPLADDNSYGIEKIAELSRLVAEVTEPRRSFYTGA